MKFKTIRQFAAFAVGGLFVASSMNAGANLVGDELLNIGGTTSGWQECDTDNAITDLTTLGNGGCAYQEFSVEPNSTYKLTCGVYATKYVSISFVFSDENYNVLAEETVEIFDSSSGSYSITMTTPANVEFAAMGVYGEHNSNVQDCLVYNVNTDPDPTHGSIAGVAWFDSNENGLQESTETIVPNTLVELYLNNQVVQQGYTDTSGKYYFGQLDFNQAYSVRFGPADETLVITPAGGDNDADPVTGLTPAVTLSVQAPDVTGIDAGFIPAPVIPPVADNSICGQTWADADADGVLNKQEEGLGNIVVYLHNNDSGTSVKTETSEAGYYNFTSLVDGNYSLEFVAPDGYYFSPSSGLISSTTSFPNADSGITASFSLPADSNAGANSTCTLQYANAGLVKEVTAIPVTVAQNDNITALVGEQLEIDVTENDVICEANPTASVEQIVVTGHNVPGDVIVTNSNIIQIVNTAVAGTYSVTYIVRGSCGSSATATLIVDLMDPVVVGPASTQMNYCRFRNARQVLELYRADTSTTQAVLDAFVQPAMVTAAGGALDLTGNMGWFQGTHQQVSAILPAATAYAAHNNWYVFGAKWAPVDQQAFPALTVVGSTNPVTITNNDGTTYIKQCKTISSPIALDIDQSGSVDRIQGEFRFDIDANGSAETLAEWFSPKEGILIANPVEGVVDGSDLFGNVAGQFKNGFEKLSVLDANKDRVISKQELNGLAIWVDENSNASLDSGELRTLESFGVMELSIDQTAFRSTALLDNGSTMLTEDLWFPHAKINLASGE